MDELALRITLLNIRTREKVCDCPIHDNELLKQVDAQLPNGKPVCILLDSYGYHVAIGARNMLGNFTCPPGVSKAEAERILQEAMQS